ERIIQRLIAGKAQVVAASRGSVDVERPKTVRLLGAQFGLLVQLSNESDVLYLNCSDLVRKVTAEGFPYCDPKTGVAGGAAAAVNQMKKLARSSEYQWRNDGYRFKGANAKGKVWVLEAKVETGGGDTLKNQLTEAVRAELVGKEMAHWIFEA